MKSVVIPNPDAECDEIAALKKMIEALDKAVKGLEEKTQAPRTKPPAAR